MLNVHAVSRPTFHVLSNGGLGFGVSPILRTRKWIKLFTETLLAFNPDFQYIAQLAGKSSDPFERA